LTHLLKMFKRWWFNHWTVILYSLQGTVVEGTIQQLFEGHHMNYIECINVDYKSTRKESFYGKSMRKLWSLQYINCTCFVSAVTMWNIAFSVDLQLDVKGCRDVYASFDKYCEVERLEGDNKYHAENHGLQVCCYLCSVASGPSFT